jgi:hypothetical protein
MAALLARPTAPSDALLRAAARLVTARQVAAIGQIGQARTIAALAEWEAGAPGARARAEAALAAAFDLRRRFFVAVLAVGRARAIAPALAACGAAADAGGGAAAGGDADAVAAAADASTAAGRRLAPDLTPVQRAAIAECVCAYRAAVRAARAGMRRALARATTAAAAAAAGAPGDGAHLVAAPRPAAAAAAAAAAADAADAARALEACAEAEAAALVGLFAAALPLASPLQQARVWRDCAPHAVDLPRVLAELALEGGGGGCGALGAGLPGV